MILVLSDLAQPYRDYIQYVVMPGAIEWLKMTYSVIPYTSTLKISSSVTSCNSKSIPASLRAGVEDTDLFIIVNWVNASSSSYVAKAGPCVLDSTTYR